MVNSDLAHQPLPPPQRGVRWVAVMTAALLLTGLGVGWRWWAGRKPMPTAIGQPQGQGLPVKLETLTAETIVDSTDFVGSLEAAQVVELRPEVTGRVQQIFVRAGDRLPAGAPIAELKPDRAEANLASVIASINGARALESNARSQLAALEADRIALIAEVELQNENYRRVEFLVKEGVLSAQQLDLVERDRQVAQANLKALEQRITAARAAVEEAQAGLNAAQANANRATVELAETVITAPFAGVVGDLKVDRGDMVRDTDTLTTLTQNQVLNLRVSIPIEKAPELRVGQVVELVTEEGNILNTGQISFIDPNVNPNQQTLLAKATFANGGELLRNGQFVRARLIWRTDPGVLVPTVAVTRLAGQPFVFVAEAPGPEDEVPPGTERIARQRPVTLGRLQGDRYHIITGLEPGMEIIISGILNLTDGAPIMPMPDASVSAPSI